MMEAEELKARVMACGWDELVAHFARGGLLMLSPGLDLLEAAAAIAGDDSAAVEGLLDSGGLSKMSDEQAQLYQQQRADVRFQFLILQPYVLAQEIVKRGNPKAN